MSESVKHPPGRDMIPQGTQSHGVPFGHESSDVNARATLIAMLVVLSSAAVAMLAMAGMFKYLNNREMAKDATVPLMIREAKQIPAGPALFPSVQDDRVPWRVLYDERKDDAKTAAKVGLTDPQTGVYRIPDNAMGNSSPDDKQAYSADDRYKWEDPDQKFTADSSGGLTLEPQKGRE